MGKKILISMFALLGFLPLQADDQFIFTNTGPADWYDSNNWYWYTLIGSVRPSPIPIPTTQAAIGNSNTSCFIDSTSIGYAPATASSLVVGQSYFPVHSGSNFLTIQNGGVLTTGPSMDADYIGNSPNSNGTVTITGANSSWTSNNFIAIGNYGAGGSGAVSVLSGGRVNCSSVNVGNNLPGTLTVDGPTSQFNSSTRIIVANNKNNLSSATFSNQAQIVAPFFIVGNDGGTGALSVESGSSLNCPIASGDLLGHSGLIIGNAGGSQGTLTINGGSSVTDGYGIVGYYAGTGAFTTPATGSATVDGSGSNWKNSKELFIGYSELSSNEGVGTLTISSSGAVHSPIVNLGYIAGSSGALHINTSGLLSTNSLAGGAGTHQVYFNGGILQATGSNPTFIKGFSSGDITIDAGGLTIDSQNFNVATNSSLLGVGPLTKIGSGTLTLNGTSSIGSTTITQGGLIVNGSLASNIVTVDSGATLSGDALVIGNVVNNGSFFPEPTFSVNGNFTQGVNSIYNNEISSARSDLLSVSGSFTIVGNPVLNLVSDLGFYYLNEYTLITYLGASTGSTFTLNSSLPGTLSYRPGSVIFTPATPPPLLTSFVQSDNAYQVAIVLDELFAAGSLSQIQASLASLSSSAEIAQALNQMQPALFKSAAVVQENNAIEVRNALSNRFACLLTNQNCFPYGSDEDKQSRCQLKTLDLNVWLSGEGSFTNQSNIEFSNSPQVGYNNLGVGIVSGADYRFLDNLYLGVLGSYTHSHIKWKQDQGKGDIDTGYAGVYFSAIGSLFYGNVSCIGGWSQYDEKRNIVYPGVNVSAKNTHQGKQLISHLDVGCNLSLGKFTIRPFDSLDWIIQNEDAYAESGAGVYNLSTQKMHASMVRNELGLNFAACGCFTRTKLNFDTSLAWAGKCG